MAWLPVTVTVPPAEEPIAIAEARAQCHVDDGEFDTELAIYIGAARERVEMETGTKLVDQTVVMRCSCFRDLESLATAPVSAIASIKYLDREGVEQTLSPEVYEPVLVGLEPSVRLKPGQAWPDTLNAADAIRIEATAGYGADAAAVPNAARYAMLLLIEDANRNRGDTNVGGIVSPMPNGVAALLVNLRKY